MAGSFSSAGYGFRIDSSSRDIFYITTRKQIAMWALKDGVLGGESAESGR
jgi:hypothetical protein